MLREIDVDFDAVHDMSLAILTTLEDQGADRNLGMAASGLTVGRLLMGPGALTTEQEADFVQGLMGWASLWFTPTSGVVN